VPYSGVRYCDRCDFDELVLKFLLTAPENGSQRAVACPVSGTESVKVHMEIGVETENITNRWYALRVRSRHENTVATHLQARGYESFLPLYKCKRRWSDRFKEIDLPLFDGYVFCRFNPLNRLPVLAVPGVVHVVGVARNPLPIDDTEIAAIQTAVKSGLPRQPWPFLEIGHTVKIEHGPLCGAEGILLGFRGNRRLVLSVTLLQRSVAVQVDESWVQPIREQRRTCVGPVTSRDLSWQSIA
jgi:transcription antitermination factor NusG